VVLNLWTRATELVADVAVNKLALNSLSDQSLQTLLFGC